MVLKQEHIDTFKFGDVGLSLQSSAFTESNIPEWVLMDIGKCGCQLTFHMNIDEFKAFVRLANSFIRKIDKLEKEE